MVKLGDYITDDQIFFDVTPKLEQILNPIILEGDTIMEKEEIGKDDNKSKEDEENCCCCNETECRLPANEWTDD